MLSFSSAVGNLFNRLGKLGALIANMRSYQGTQLQAMTNTTTGVVAQYNGESDIQAEMGSAYIGLLNGEGTVASVAQQIAQDTLNRMVFRDQPRIAQNLQSLNITDSISELIRQMQIQGASVLAQTITATPSTSLTHLGSFTGVGTGIISASFRRPVDGLVLENIFAEAVLFTCTQDSYIGGAIAGNEGITVTGVGSEDNPFAFDWPLGSNASAFLNVIDGNADNSSGNLLTNSGFNAFTSNVPTNWHLTVGTDGIDIDKEVTLVYDGTAAIRFFGAGTPNVTLQQQFGVDTPGQLAPLTQYGFNIFARREAIAAGAGILTIALVDQNGTIINDQGGNPNSFTINLSTLTTNYVAFNAAFRTPLILPTSQFIQMRITTPLTINRSVYVDKAAFGPMTQLYVGGPYLAVWAGNQPFTVRDYGTMTFTNSRGAAGTLNTWQTVFSLLLPQAAQGEFLLPSAPIPTISDNLLA